MVVNQQKRAAFAKLRDLQGLPLTVLALMLIEGDPVTKKHIATTLDHHEDTVGSSVDFLTFEGYIQRLHHRAWALADNRINLAGLEFKLLGPGRALAHRPNMEIVLWKQRQTALATLKEIQGLPLTILFAMIVENKPVSKKYLATVLRRHKDTISKAVDLLTEKGYIKKEHYRAWSLIGKQLTLPGFEIGLTGGSRPNDGLVIDQAEALDSRTLEEAQVLNSRASENPDPAEILTSRTSAGECSPQPQDQESAQVLKSRASGNPAEPKVLNSRVSDEPPEPEVLNSRASEAETPEFGTSGLPTTTTTNSDSEIDRAVVVEQAQVPKLRTSRAGHLDSRALLEIGAALARIRINGRGIGQNQWREIAACAWVTPHYLRAMAALVNAHPDPAKRNTGFFIYCVLNHDPEPEWCEACGELDGKHTYNCSARCRQIEALPEIDVKPTPEPADPDRAEAGRIWQAALEDLVLQMTRGTFNTWLKTTKGLAYENGTFTVEVPNAFVQDWLANRLRPAIERTLANIVGEDVQVDFLASAQEGDP